MECGIRPDTAWPETKAMFPLAWKAASLIHCNSIQLAKMVSEEGGNAKVWQFAYEDSIVIPRNLPRDIDVLFPARCSATNYSNHLAFIRAFNDDVLCTCMTDPTNYLGHSLELGSVEYSNTLHRSKVVVGLTDNGYGGYAFREAIAAGACPVALDTPEYRELLTDAWPYLCTLDDVRQIAEKALATGWKSLGTKLVQQVSENLRNSSYSQAWISAKEDLCL